MTTADKLLIGGAFPLETLPNQNSGWIEQIVGPQDDIRHMMSGRCGILLSILDWMHTDQKRVAYLPAFTCETVMDGYVKAGYRIVCYDLDPQLNPLYDPAMLEEISIFHLCGYFGFNTFDEVFAQQCANRGIAVLLDATHSVFSKGGIPDCVTYVASSFRKWFGVTCGGIAIKRGGQFLLQPEEIHQSHLDLRYACLSSSGVAIETQNATICHHAETLYWDAELLLRKVFSIQKSDQQSIDIVNGYPVSFMIQKRRENYLQLLEGIRQLETIQPFFPVLSDGVCPSHFSVYAQNRDALQKHCKEQGIVAKLFWPVPPYIEAINYPGATYIYNHILSLPCDQRYGPQEMQFILDTLGSFV